MADWNAESLINTQASTCTAVGVTGDGPSGDVSGNDAPVVSGEAVPVSGCGNSSGMDYMSRFGSLGYGVLPSAEARGGDRDENRATWSVGAPDGDFQLMCVRRFIFESGKGNILERGFEGNYDLVGYLRGRLDQ